MGFNVVDAGVFEPELEPFGLKLTLRFRVRTLNLSLNGEGA